MNTIQKRIIDLSFEKKLSHLSSCLNASDIINTIYMVKGNDDPFVLSAGHLGVALYSVLEDYNLGKTDAIWAHHGTHPDYCERCRIDCSTGSLGQGLPIAVGMAMARLDQTVYCLITDGESMEGSVMEALRIAAHYRLVNLKVVCLYNGYGAYSEIELKPLISKFQSCGFGVLKIDEDVPLKMALEAKIDDIPIMALVEADTKKYPLWLQGQPGHYVVLDEKKKKELEDSLWES